MSWTELVGRLAFAYLQLINFILLSDNAVLADLLPGVVDGAIDLVLKVQGPTARSGATDGTVDPDSDILPGAYKLIFDEKAGFEFKSSLKK